MTAITAEHAGARPSIVKGEIRNTKCSACGGHRLPIEQASGSWLYCADWLLDGVSVAGWRRCTAHHRVFAFSSRHHYLTHRFTFVLKHVQVSMTPAPLHMKQSGGAPRMPPTRDAHAIFTSTNQRRYNRICFYGERSLETCVSSSALRNLVSEACNCLYRRVSRSHLIKHRTRTTRASSSRSRHA